MWAPGVARIVCLQQRSAVVLAESLGFGFLIQGAGVKVKMGDQATDSPASSFGLHLRSCLRDSKSVWKTPWGNSILNFDPKPRLPPPFGPLPLVVPASPSADSPAASTTQFVRSEGLEQVCAKMAKFKHKSWEVMLNEERNLAVNKWLSLI